ncbi:MAG: type II toxin-antitoxin system prevent-host-death family antitoxin [Mariprofundaceae bacterium]|nr:type II toxin-antitoxin system prevent-host-death family antitoxin [Mariprofundaceae bacterium]
MKTNAVDLRRNMKDIMRAVERNEPVTVLYHGKEKAMIRAIEQTSASSVRSHAFFGMNQDNSTVERVMDGLRNGRY